MKIYKTLSGIIVESDGKYYPVKDHDWDTFINDDDLSGKLQKSIQSSVPMDNGEQAISTGLAAPIGSQELWACGVTYLRSKIGRQEESKQAGGGDFYARVYEAERPEVFFKCTPHRVVGHGGKVRIRKDSTWNVPEPELTLLVTSSGKIIGYTIGNDMSSRSIEGENPLYLPQAKTYDGCVALGPCIYVNENDQGIHGSIHLDIFRDDKKVFEGKIGMDQMKRTHEELVSFVYRECSFPHGSLIMTGTGIVPPNDFTLHPGDEIRISIDEIGTLINGVEQGSKILIS
ncbi:MAG: fumarylacetoacetate hydrolase family protein [Chitinophagales bacterium]|nr:fumarylacetoacetate hydrolase family protein [Chitinophagales bacterium]